MSDSLQTLVASQVRVTAKAVVINQDGNVLLLRRSKTDTRRPLQWDFPGGLVEDGEEFLMAVSREIAEETGIRVQPDKLYLVSTDTASLDGETAACWLFFMCQTTQTSVRLSYEHDDYTWVSLEQAIRIHQYERQRNVLIHIRDQHLLPLKVAK